ncbi:hypothetical protein Tco_0966955 [Tanacetum coccineum]
MEMKYTLSSCSDLDEQEIQQLQIQAKNLQEISMNKFNALKTTIQHLSNHDFPMNFAFTRAFHQLFDAREVRKDFKQYTHMEAQSFKDLIIQHMDSIEQCIVERALHEQEIQNRLKRLNERKLQIQECKNQSNTSGDKSSRSRNDTDIRPSYDTEPIVEVSYTAEYNVFAIETQHFEQLENMTDISLMEKIQKQLRNANASLAHELKECKSTLEETNRTLGESNSTWDRCIIALQNKEIELEKYKTYNDRALEYDKLERKLKDC